MGNQSTVDPPLKPPVPKEVFGSFEFSHIYREQVKYHSFDLRKEIPSCTLGPFGNT